MTLELNTLELLRPALEQLDTAWDAMPQFDHDVDTAAIADVLREVALRMQDNLPYPHPMYAGQMLKPPHPVARLAYMLSLWVNPNNHALDGGRASSAMEKAAVAAIAAMFGWADRHLGHLTSGGTMANLEALWVAGRIHPGKCVVASSEAHYTHSRISAVLGLPFDAVAVDDCARLDTAALELRLARGDVGTVVASLGTTGFGSVDNLPELLRLKQQFGFRLHVDAAYGGYFRLASNLGANAADAFAIIDQADSIVIDPHKHGLQPYGCGCVLFRDPALGRYYQHDSPYTYFSSDELHLGEISLECSRAGASAVALWATQQLLPMTPGAAFALDMERCRDAALHLYALVSDDPDELTLLEPELDIVAWAPKGATASEISERARAAFAAAARADLHLALLRVPSEWLARRWAGVKFDTDTVTVLRSCLMKPEHLQWVDRIWSVYRRARSVS